LPPGLDVGKAGPLGPGRFDGNGGFSGEDIGVVMGEVLGV